MTNLSEIKALLPIGNNTGTEPGGPHFLVLSVSLPVLMYGSRQALSSHFLSFVKWTECNFSYRAVVRYIHKSHMN